MLHRTFFRYQAHTISSPIEAELITDVRLLNYTNFLKNCIIKNISTPKNIAD